MWQDHVKNHTSDTMMKVKVLLPYYITIDAWLDLVFASVMMVYNVPAEVMLFPVVILTCGHVVAESLKSIKFCLVSV